MQLTKKQLVILAKSRMGGGLCFAGRELGGERAWVRITGGTGSRESAIQSYECQYHDGPEAQLLDVVDIAFKEKRPKEHQRENWLIDPNEYWSKCDTMLTEHLDALADDDEVLWYDNKKQAGSTVAGSMNRVPRKFAQNQTDSLRLLKVPDLCIKLCPPYTLDKRQNRPKLYARFSHRGKGYALNCTDVAMEYRYLRYKSESSWNLGAAFVCISLASVDRGGHAYKLVAGVMLQT